MKTKKSINLKILIPVIVIFIIIIIIIIYIISHRKKTTSTDLNAKSLDFLNKLNGYMTDDLRCPPLEKGGTVRVYVSAGMFDIADTLYAIGVDGMKPGLDYQSINLVDQICNFSNDQMKQLQDLCVLWDVPWYGISGEIQKLGWECYCPVRDGLTMATVASAISNCVYNDVVQQYDAGDAGYRKWEQSMFNPINIPIYMGVSNPTQEQILAWAKGVMLSSLGINIGANDLYNMYSTCNCCIMNYNGIEPDAGAVAEIGQLGARGVPSVILKGNINSDFGSATNPMPLMATSAQNLILTHLTNNSGSVFNANDVGALPFLVDKVNRFIEANENNDSDIITNGNYNNLVPLPPLQIFWSELGSKAYFLKHKSKSIKTLSNGKTDFKNDYTDFWYKNVVQSVGTTGLVQVGKVMADNLDYLKKQPKYTNIFKYWT